MKRSKDKVVIDNKEVQEKDKKKKRNQDSKDSSRRKEVMSKGKIITVRIT